MEDKDKQKDIKKKFYEQYEHDIEKAMSQYGAADPRDFLDLTPEEIKDIEEEAADNAQESAEKNA